MTNYNAILAQGGATLNKGGNAVQLKTGYQVSSQDVAVIAAQDFNQAAVDNIVSMLTSKGMYAGFWLDDGKVYCDISRRHSTKKDALAAGRAYNQIAVWDWKHSKSVYC